MTTPLARAIVRLSAYLAPRADRQRWREEWRGELEATAESHLRHALGAPWDALALRWLSFSDAMRPLRRAWLVDIQHAGRIVRRDSRHSAAISVCIGFGVAASLVTMAVLNAVLFGRMPGVVDRSSLYQLHVWQGAGRFSVFQTITPDQFQWLAAKADSVTLAAEGVHTLAARIGEESRPVTVAFVSGGYFDLLGTRPAAGRLLGQGDDRPDGFVAVVSERFRTRHLTGSWQESLTVSGQPIAIVGVAEDRFVGAGFRSALHDSFSPIDVWVPLRSAPAWSFAAASAADLTVDVVARLPAGASAAVAGERIEASTAGMPLDDGLLKWTGEKPTRRGVRLAHLGHPSDSTPASIALFAAALMAAPLVVLAIACANAANLRLAQASARARDLAVRLALGASRAQLVRLLCLESLLLAGGAAIVGWLAAGAALAVFTASVPLPVELDARVVLFTVVLVVAATVLFGMAPAFASTGRLMRAGLRQTARGGGRSHARFRRLMVGAQVALSIGLLVIAALFARMFQHQMGTRPAIASEILVADVDLSRLRYDGPAAARFAIDLAARVQSDNRVTAVGLSDQSLMPGADRDILRPGEVKPSVRAPDLVHVTPGWFDVFGLRPSVGRLLQDGDARAAVAVVDDDLAKQLASDRPVLGMPLRLLQPGSRAASVVAHVEVAGVVPNGMHRLRARRGDARLYVPLGTSLIHGEEFPSKFTIFARTIVPAEVGRDLGRLITEMDPRGVSFNVATAETLLERDENVRLARAGAIGVGSAGLLALVLAAAGIYTAVSYSVSLQVREIGIRLAIGARPREAVALIVRQAMTNVGAGILAGVIIAIGVARVLASELAGVSSFDPVSIAGASLFLFAVGSVAALLPARWAARVDPVQVLRAE